MPAKGNNKVAFYFQSEFYFTNTTLFPSYITLPQKEENITEKFFFLIVSQTKKPVLNIYYSITQRENLKIPKAP